MKSPLKDSRTNRSSRIPGKMKLSKPRVNKVRHALSDNPDILKKRIKELNCIYILSRIFKKRALDIDSIIHETIDIMPAAWQYPDITGVFILLDSKEYKTDKFDPDRWVQRCPIITNGVQVGEIVVSYSERRPDRDEGPFLKEERRLLNYIAQRLSERNHRRSVEQRLVIYQEELRSLTTELALSEERERRKIARGSNRPSS